jgi:molybdenum cofactor cytidylyltransferase
MRFGPLPLSEAAGAILAHSVDVPGGSLRKGTVLGEDTLAALRAAGRESVICARLDAGDVGEDPAAERLARAMVAGEGLRLTPAATGRVNVHAMGAGIVGVDAARVDAANGVNPLITVATLAPFARVGEGGMVATIKMIAWGVPEDDLERACDAGRGALRLHVPVIRTASLIETTVTGREPAVKGRQALSTRLERLGVILGPRVVVAHEAPAIADAVAAADGEVVFVLTASATSDPADVGPEGVRLAGGEVVQVGIPVDPGNLLFLGAVGGRPVIGLPGCARSPALNGADFVLERVICGVPVGPGDLARLGVGGLLKDIPARGRPREG